MKNTVSKLFLALALTATSTTAVFSSVNVVEIETSTGPKITKDEFPSVLSVSPAKLTTGQEIVLVADLPKPCTPVFINLAINGRVTPIPQNFFKQTILGSGQHRYEISPGAQFGLVIEKQDPRGINTLGYFCEPENLSRGKKVALIKSLRKKIAENILQGNVDVVGAGDVMYHFQQYEIQ